MIAFLVILCACKSDVEQFRVDKAVPIDVVTSQGVSIPVFDFPNLNTMLEYDHDTLYLFNFWATWCGPCVKELPNFDMIDSAYADKPVRVVLISLNFKEDIEGLLIPFLIEKEIKSRVVLLDEPDGDTWMPIVDPSWSGSIPATMFKLKNNKEFRVHAFTYEELAQEVESFLYP